MEASSRGTHVASIAYKRALLKLSGAVMAGDRGYGIDQDALARLADETKGRNKCKQPQKSDSSWSKPN